MNGLQEILARMRELRANIETLAAVEGDLDDAQRADWDAYNGEYDTLEAERAVLQARSDRLNALRSADLTLATGDGAAAADQHRTAALQVVVKPDQADIYDRSALHVENPDDGGAYRDRALRAIDSWRSALPEWKESAKRLVDHADESRRDRTVANHILDAGNPIYIRAFSKFLKGGPQVLPLLEREEAAMFAEVNQRAINEGSVSAGQALVPPFLDPTIILTNAGVVNPFRGISRVESITTQTWKGVTSAGVTAEWTAEAAEMADASPTFTQPTFTPVRADAYIQASFETIEDTSIATDVAMLMADAKDRLEGAAFAVGTGSTQPSGSVTGVNAVTASRTAATTNGLIGLVDLYNMDGNLPPRYRPNASWTMNKSVINVVRQATIPSLTNFSPWVDFGGAVPSKAIGYSVYEASGMQSGLATITAGQNPVVLLGDFRQGYLIVDRIGMAVAYNPLVLGSNRRPTGEVGWAAFWRVTGGVVNAAAFQVLRT